MNDVKPKGMKIESENLECRFEVFFREMPEDFDSYSIDIFRRNDECPRSGEIYFRSLEEMEELAGILTMYVKQNR